MVRAKAAMPDEFPSAPKNVNYTPSTSGAKIKVGESKKTLGLEESSNADFTDSEFSSIESESDRQTVPELPLEDCFCFFDLWAKVAVPFFDGFFLLLMLRCQLC